ncbi:MAG: hypothetical protein C4541_00030 [Candidatus Auribacter fodinae]|jgi:hypothetical protein|uniref:PEP-CTERM sorting domain-containing protein n=1 Tax=Candidatus Auribacter fodinae TaxID=2093366 RepID=A0A3A4RAJ9_9BACT|nr:MAG: hypothetical protein C4541_00030 [Candidatus Auribacter fodinae]
MNVRNVFIFAAMAVWAGSASVSATNFTIQQITNNTVDDLFPALYNDTLAWSRGGTLAYKVGANLTTTAYAVTQHFDPIAVYGNNIAFNNIKAYNYNISTQSLTELTPYSGAIFELDIYQNTIVWQHNTAPSFGEVSIYTLPSGPLTAIAPGVFNVHPSIYGNQIVMKGDTDIQLYNMTTQQFTSVPGSNGGYFPEIYGNSIAWMDMDRTKVYYYNGSVTQEIFAGSFPVASDGGSVEIFDDIIVWSALDVEDGGADYEIFVYREGVVEQVTHNDYNDWNPSIYDTIVVWSGQSDSDWELFSTEVPPLPVVPPIPEPLSICMMSIGMLISALRKYLA